MKPSFVLASLLVALILVCGCTGTTTDPAQLTEPGAVVTSTAQVQDYTFTQTITSANENGTTVITKNKLTKTATIDLTMVVDSPESEGTLINKTWYYELMTGLTAGLMQMALFNETALEEWNAQVEEWNAQEWTVEDDSPPDQAETTPSENLLGDYMVQKMTIRMVERGSGTIISDTVITGPDKADVVITYH